MRKNLTTLVTALTLFAALVIPVQLAAQERQDKKEHHHYKLIDMGTFGGPQSYVFPSARVLSNHGTLAGYADTSTPDPYSPFCFIPDCFVSHAFQWRRGVRTDLGVLPGGLSSASTFISASGLIAGFSQNGQIDPLFPGLPEARAVLWNHGKIVNLGTLEGGYESVANAVNNNSQVVGGATNTIPDSNAMTLSTGLGTFFPPIPYQVRAFLWQHGVMQDLGTLGGTDAQAVLINEAGQVVGWSYTSSAPGVCAPSSFLLTTGSFIWDKENGMVDLGSLGGTCTLANDLNNQGQVVGSSFPTGDAFQRAFLWEHGSIQDLGGSFGGNNTGAFAINDHGQAVGFGYYPGEVTFHAALWRHVGEITDLGTVGNNQCSYAAAINAEGQVVGGSGTGSECGINGFLWEDGGPMVDLNTLIPSNSEFHMAGADDINDRGEIAVTGVDASGNRHEVLLIPCDERHLGVEGCDYSLVDAVAATQSAPPRYVPSGTRRPPQSRRTNRYRIPGRGTGPAN